MIRVTPALDGKELPHLTDSRTIPVGRRAIVAPGTSVVAGAALTDGPIDLQQVLEVLGPWEVLRALQREFQGCGVELGNRELESLTRLIVGHVLVTDPGAAAISPLDVVPL